MEISKVIRSNIIITDNVSHSLNSLMHSIVTDA